MVVCAKLWNSSIHWASLLYNGYQSPLLTESKHIYKGTHL